MTDTTSSDAPRDGDRIAKLLARAGIASRREIERMITEGRVKLNGVVVTTPATVLPGLRGITVDDQPVAAPEATRLFLFHKPSGLITAERDPAGRPTIYAALRNALPPGTPRVMPVGRLDLNTEGLLLLTNDGELKRAMELPSSLVPRTYRARTYGDISQDRLEELIEGIEIDGMRYGKIDANMERRTGRNQWIELTLTEGKNREVRRVLEYLGLEVSRLLRIAYGPFVLGNLPRGTAGEIAPGDVERFRRTLGLGAQDPGHVRHTARADQPAKSRPAPVEPDGRRRAARPARPEAPRRGSAPPVPTDAPSGDRRAPKRVVRRRDDDAGPLLGRDEARGRRGRSQRGPGTAPATAGTAEAKRGPAKFGDGRRARVEAQRGGSGPRSDSRPSGGARPAPRGDGPDRSGPSGSGARRPAKPRGRRP